MDADGRLNGIWGLHLYCDVCFLFSGAHSDTLGRVVKSLWPSNTAISMQHKWASLAEIVGTGGTQDVKVEPFEEREGRDEAFCKWMLEAEQTKQPMMVYGADEELKKKFRKTARPMIQATTVDEVTKLQNNAQGMTKEAVFLADEYGCGLDISFKINPKVVILCGNVPPSQYQFRQFAGRAQRGD